MAFPEPFGRADPAIPFGCPALIGWIYLSSKSVPPWVHIMGMPPLETSPEPLYEFVFFLLKT
jgi:hypothetical protein